MDSLWLASPVISNYCCMTENYNEFISIIRRVLKFYNFHNIAQAISTSEFQRNMKENCEATNDDKYCNVAYAIPMLEQAASLPGSKQYWTEQDNQAVDAILFHLTVLIKSIPSVYNSLQDLVTADKQKEVFTYIINQILKYMQEGDYTALKDFQNKLPKMQVYTQTSPSCNSDIICICMKIIAQLDSYVEELEIHETSLVINGRKRILLNTGIDYIEFLKQKQLDRILQVLDEQHLTSMSIATALKGEIISKFTSLKSYYKHVASFNGDIATADIGYITGRLDGFKERITSIVDTFKNKMGILLIQMFVGIGVEIAEATVTMALAIADACNPIGWITGGADPNSVADAIADFANAMSLLPKGIAVQIAWSNVQTKASEIGGNFGRNRVLLENVKVLVYKETKSHEEFEIAKNGFLNQYKSYDPQVSHDDLVKVTAMWSGLVAAACAVIDAFTTSAGAIVRGVVNGQNLCVDLPVLAERMGGLYENIYDFQFDLMDAVAEYMRAKVTEDAAEEINTELTTISGKDPDDEKTLATLQIMGGLTFVTYKTHILQAINRYCNILQYKEGGKQPIECKGPSTDLSLLISRQGTTCTKERFRYYQVPTTPSGQNDKAYVDISELFKGATVNFKIPNSQWLVDHHWINANEMNQTFLIEELEVFLPITPTRPTHFSVTADPILNNQLHSGINDTEYMMVPHVLLTSEYDMGPKRTYCRLQKISNPYTSCGAEQRSFVCSSSDSFPRSNHGVYPSLYSEWAIKIKGGEHLTSPNPATEMSVIFGLKLCIAAANDDIFDDLVKRNEVDDCCPSGQYRPNITADCADCPVKSHSALAGYYCAIN